MMSSSLVFDYKPLGVVQYEKALGVQHEFHELCLKEKTEGVFLSLEHFPVITIGKNADASDVLYPKSFLEAKGIELYSSDRGGQATCHMPGQLVLYPILSLERLLLGVKEYIKILEESLLELLSEYGVKGDLDEKNPGIWVLGKKIASIGVRVKNRTTLHGLALNIDNNLDLFNFIIPCGMKDCSMTRLVDQSSQKIDKKDISIRLVEKIAQRLGGETRLSESKVSTLEPSPCCIRTIEDLAKNNPMMACGECGQIIKCFLEESSFQKYLIFCQSRKRKTKEARYKDYKIILFKKH